jgi:superfamily II DNA or RNA helicase
LFDEKLNSRNEFRLAETDVCRFFGSTYAGRGDTYQRSGRVLSADFDPASKTLIGRVRGSAHWPYGVKLRFTDDLASIKSADCSCPMTRSCKHCAAVLLDLIRKRPGTHVSLISPPAENATVPAAEGRSIRTIEALRSENFGKHNAYLGEVSRSQISSEFETWIDKLHSDLESQPRSLKNDNKDSVVYLLDIAPRQNQLVLKVAHAKKLKTGSWSKAQKADLDRLSYSRPGYATEEDCEIAKLFVLGRNNYGWTNHNTFPEILEVCRILIERILATGRCYWKELGDEPLSLGAPQEGALQWETQTDGKQLLKLYSSSATDITAIAGMGWYINVKTRTLGPLTLPVPAKAIKTILSAPAIEPSEAMAVSERLAGMGTMIPTPKADFKITTVKLKPSASLTLVIDEPRWGYFGKKTPKALVTFDYGNGRFDVPGSSEYRSVENGQIVIYKKDAYSEALRIRQLQEQGLSPIFDASLRSCSAVYGFENGTDIDWLKFCSERAAKLQVQGWQVIFDKSFNLQVVVPEEQWSLDATEGSDFWFSLDLGITVEGMEVPLLPVIYEALRWLPDKDPLTGLKTLNHNGIFYAPLSDGRHVALPFKRVETIVSGLVELFDKTSRVETQVSKLSLPQLIDLSARIESVVGNGGVWSVGEKLKGLITKVRRFQGLEKVKPPESFGTELRSYQVEGLSWLNFLREFELGGVLADDMGLGKTVQTLAHISLEKKEKRLNKPFLVVCPTSVLPNWMSEIEKFAPDLKATSLYGPGRAKDFARISGSDIVVTTYPLISRDSATLLAQKWKAVVLDEAQTIKNPSTQVAQAVGKLRCDYRFCLTGTPVENHLGELWSQFNFLMPGFLKDLHSFTKTFRTPIEKHKDKEAQRLLAGRVRPFLLRRTKELVAKDLPEKSIIIKRVELEGAQRDLYETVRLAMYEKVKEALAAKGLEKSQIIILDALLKLRQVCCDPRLLSLSSAKKVHSTAKLDLLLSMLGELVDEGKRILLFSQFTSMLDLIVPELNRRHIEFEEIRGDTRDRATPVQRFQKGTVPLFLLSLKAGGFGLNLTAADTVIHYDPWWNPAVENQATDRAHRIGQSKSVFVFKLIASGTIEERMLELQERKKAIAQAVFDEENSLPFKLTADDLESLFIPLKA